MFCLVCSGSSGAKTIVPGDLKRHWIFCVWLARFFLGFFYAFEPEAHQGMLCDTACGVYGWQGRKH